MAVLNKREAKRQYFDEIKRKASNVFDGVNTFIIGSYVVKSAMQ